MRNRTGVIVSIVASLLLLAILVWPYVVKPPSAITTYYTRGVLTPLLPGMLVVGILITFAAVRENYLSANLGAGIAFGLSLFTFFIMLVWAVTARLDVFRAPTWALPAQRFILVGLSLVIVFGIGWHTWANSLLSLRR